MPTAKFTITALALTLALSVACLLTGFLAASLVLSAYMFLPLLLVLLCAAILLAVGSTLCLLAARRLPFLWILWPFLFGGPMFIFGVGGESSPPDPAGTFLWRSLAAAYLIAPALAAFGGRAENRLAHEKAVGSRNQS